jgi:hypothetical protein
MSLTPPEQHSKALFNKRERKEKIMGTRENSLRKTVILHRKNFS